MGTPRQASHLKRQHHPPWPAAQAGICWAACISAPRPAHQHTCPSHYPKHPESVPRLLSSRPPASLLSLRRSPHQAPRLHPLPEHAWDPDRASVEAFPGLHDRWTPDPFLRPPSKLSQVHPCPGLSPPPLPCAPALPSLLPRSPLSFADPYHSSRLRAPHMLFPLPVTPFLILLPPNPLSLRPSFRLPATIALLCPPSEILERFYSRLYSAGMV